MTPVFPVGAEVELDGWVSFLRGNRVSQVGLLARPSLRGECER